MNHRSFRLALFIVVLSLTANLSASVTTTRTLDIGLSGRAASQSDNPESIADRPC